MAKKQNVPSVVTPESINSGLLSRMIKVEQVTIKLVFAAIAPAWAAYQSLQRAALGEAFDPDNFAVDFAKIIKQAATRVVIGKKADGTPETKPRKSLVRIVDLVWDVFVCGVRDEDTFKSVADNFGDASAMVNASYAFKPVYRLVDTLVKCGLGIASKRQLAYRLIGEQFKPNNAGVARRVVFELMYNATLKLAEGAEPIRLTDMQIQNLETSIAAYSRDMAISNLSDGKIAKPAQLTWDSILPLTSLLPSIEKGKKKTPETTVTTPANDAVIPPDVQTVLADVIASVHTLETTETNNAQA